MRSLAIGWVNVVKHSKQFFIGCLIILLKAYYQYGYKTHHCSCICLVHSKNNGDRIIVKIMGQTCLPIMIKLINKNRIKSFLQHIFIQKLTNHYHFTQTFIFADIFILLFPSQITNLNLIQILHCTQIVVLSILNR